MAIKPELRDDLCVTLLIELLSYQFASPVRWIETQDVILNDFKAERIIEVGPSPILTNMATRTIGANSSREMAEGSLLKRKAYCTSNHLDKIYYNGESVTDPVKEEEIKWPSKAALPTNKSCSVSSADTLDSISTNKLSQDVELNATHIVKAIVSSKLSGIKYSQVNLNKSLKELSNGKSTLQNEIKSDLIKEFQSLNDDNIEDRPLLELCSELQADKMGPVTLPQVIKFVAKNLTGKFSTLASVRSYLAQDWSMVDPNPLMLFMAYSKNSLSSRFGSEESTKEFIDDCCHLFAEAENISVISSKLFPGSSNAFEDDKPRTISQEEYNLFNQDLLKMHSRQYELLGDRFASQDDKRKILSLQGELQIMQEKFIKLKDEFGEELLNGSTNFMFTPSKVRVYDSAWNWVRQDVLQLFYSNLADDANISSISIRKNVKNILNRVDRTSLEILKYCVEKCHNENWRNFLYGVINECQSSISLQPTSNGNLSSLTSMSVTGGDNEKMNLEINSHLEQYVKTISLGKSANDFQKNSSIVSTKLDTDVSSYYKIETELFQVYSKIIQYALVASNSNPTDLWGQFKSLYEQLLIFLKNSDQIASFFRAIVTDALSAINKPLYSKEENIVIHDYSVDSSSDDDYDSSIDEEPVLGKRDNKFAAAALDWDKEIIPRDSFPIPVGVIPFLHIKRHSNTNENWIYDKAYTQIYLNNLLKIGRDGLCLSDKTALLLVSGIGNDFVREIIQALIQAGATVLVATNDFDLNTTRCFQDIYHQYGAKGSKLVVLPLNSSSKIDIQKLCDYVYSNYEDLDYLLPLSTPELEKSSIEVSSAEELNIRCTVLNIRRLLGSIVNAKKEKQIETRPTLVLLPQSPVSGSNNTNGFLAESYSSLSKVLDMWHIENWKKEITICGCVYGWTTQPDNDVAIAADGLEKLGIRTFSSYEMAFNVIGLLTYDIVSLSQDSPIIADLNGGLHMLPNVMSVLNAMRSGIAEQRFIEANLENESLSDRLTLSNQAPNTLVDISPRGNQSLDFPALLDYSELQKEFNGSYTSGFVDPSHIVVVTGFAEVGPWGNSRTRWEMESTGVFSLEGCIEMAWIMGLIKYEQKTEFCGWVDSKTGVPVQGKEIKELYEPFILKHSGIRLIEPELFCGYNPSRKQMLQEVVLNQDLQQIRTSIELGEQYKREQGDYVEVSLLEDEECHVRFLKGASLYIPKALDIERMVAGQIPTGWDARSYGIPDDIASQVDPITLFALVSTAEAFICSGITDPYEMYKYVHVSEVGNCVGSGVGGMKSHCAMQLFRTKGEAVQSDILPETFINVTAAWINMLLVSSSGPIKTPVGACATAVESLEIGYETIMSGKSKVCIVGGVDDFHENISHEFANMGATSNSTEETKMGRDPREMCRPATSSRNGFMESQGAGTQIIMRGDLAIKMGAPIYGVIGMTSTASDKISKSLPAPGKGILTCARELARKPRFGLSKLNINYRRRQFEFRKQEIYNWRESEILLSSDVELVDYMVKKQISEAKLHWGSDFWKSDPAIAPIRGALSVFGLSIDDLGVVSCHGTSTKANEKNESQIINKMMDHLGRTKGNPLIAVFQKHLTGHPKGAAGAWMLNGCLQMMNHSLIPGNKNADNIDNSFEQFDHLVFPSVHLHSNTLKACMLTSFGFGQKGAMAIVLNPNYFLACLDEKDYNSYICKRNQREMRTQTHFVNGMVSNKIVQVKHDPPYSAQEQEQVYLDPLARLTT